VVTDPLPGLSSIACPGTTLTAGANMTCTASYLVTQDDVDSGSISNTATVTGTPPGAVPPVSAQDATTVPPSQLASIDLQKSASAPSASGVVSYAFQVANTGNLTLANVTVTDPLPGLSTVSCPDTTLAPSASMTCMASYTLTQADLDAGVIPNTATASGVPPAGPAVTDQDSAAVVTSQAARVDLAKTATGPDPLTVGTVVNYSFLVTNIGQLALTGVTVTDPLAGLSAISCPGTTLAPGASMTCTASYTITQADVEAGVITNTATAQGTPPNDLAPVSDQDSAAVPPSTIDVPTLPRLVLVLLLFLLPTVAIWQLRRIVRAAAARE
jgi:uncharacterized repeat protein (TIGR01451 family)